MGFNLTDFPGTLPSLSDPANFNTNAQALFDWIVNTLVSELNGTLEIGGTGDQGLQIESTTFGNAQLDLMRTSANSYRLTNDGGDFKIQHGSTPAGVATNTRLTILDTGEVGIGTTTPSEKLDVVGNVEVNGNLVFNGGFRSINQSTATDLGVQILGATSNTDGANIAVYGKDHATLAGDVYITSGGATGVGETIFRRRTDSAFITSMTIDSSGDVSITGALSKGSGSFKIDHPIKPETHHLVHSFVESPQADNIYRGTVTLVDGQATVNLDTACRMSEGTFVALNGNVQCFTSNEDGWTAVRGSVSGNILTIEAQDNTCTDTVSWMVVGERIDQHMIDASWTDDNGRVITEPLKPESPE